MYLKKLLTKSFLVAAGLLVGTSAWAEEVILSPSADSWLNYKSGDGNSTTNYGTATSLTAGIWQDMWTNATPGLKNNNYGAFTIMKFDVSAYKGKITNASFKITATLSSTKNQNRDLFIGYYTGTDWEEATVTASNSGINHRATSGLNIGHLGTFANIAKNSTAEYTCSTLSALVDYLNNDADGIVSLIFYTYTEDITIASKEAVSGKPTLTLTYTNETLYSATFNESNSLDPDITVYTDEDRTSEIAYNQLSSNTTYYYTAVKDGYENYNGSFAVETSNPTVNFTMTAKARYTFTVNAVDGSSNVIKVIYTDSESYEGKSHNITYPKYLTGTNNIVTYIKANNTFGENKIAQAKDETYTVNYSAYDGIAYFVEIEDVVSASYNSWNCSNGFASRGFTDAKSIFTIPATGIYDITYAACNNNVSYDLAVTLSKNDTEIATKSDLKSVSINYIKSNGIVVNNNISLSKDDVLKLTPSSTNGIIDYMLIELKSISATTLDNAGYATFASEYPLDLTTANMPAGVTAYKAAVNGKTAKFTALNQTVPANTGILLKGAANAEVTINVVASGTAVEGNAFLVNEAGTTFSAESGYYYFAMLKNAADLTFATFAPGTLAIPASKAYLKVAESKFTGGARLFVSFDEDETTGINEELRMKNEESSTAPVYNLNGQRVAQPTRGLYIVNGKKIVVK